MWIKLGISGGLGVLKSESIPKVTLIREKWRVLVHLGHNSTKGCSCLLKVQSLPGPTDLGIEFKLLSLDRKAFLWSPWLLLWPLFLWLTPATHWPVLTAFLTFIPTGHVPQCLCTCCFLSLGCPANPPFLVTLLVASPTLQVSIHPDSFHDLSRSSLSYTSLWKLLSQSATHWMTMSHPCLSSRATDLLEAAVNLSSSLFGCCI